MALQRGGAGGLDGEGSATVVPAAFQVPAACEGGAAGLPEQAWGGSAGRHQELYQLEVKGSYEVSLGKGCAVSPCQTRSCPGLGAVHGRCVWERAEGAAGGAGVAADPHSASAGQRTFPAGWDSPGRGLGGRAVSRSRLSCTAFHRDTGGTYTDLRGFATGRCKF